jgi:hypothetical protein
MLTSAPNTQPIFPRIVFVWKKIITDKVIAEKKITTNFPVLLGKAGVNGSLIHNIQVRQLGENPSVVVKLFVKSSEDEEYFLENEQLVPAGLAGDDESLATNFVLPPVLPNIEDNRALHLSSNLELFAAVSVAVINGIVITVRGGHY